MARKTADPDFGRICKNCSAPVVGRRFCASCGQRTDTRILTFRELFEELMDGMLDMDSRLWHSLIPLVAMPGKLTTEYLSGRRQYYLPPFRLYLILSVLFFLIPNDRIDFNNDFSPPPREELARQIQGEVADDVGVNPQTHVRNGNVDAGANFEEALREREAEGRDPRRFCELRQFDHGSFLTLVLADACYKVVDNPKYFLDTVLDTMPVLTMMTIPLVALVMQLLYAFSQRRYVEHIIFLSHAHAFFFLISILLALTSILGQSYPILYSPMNSLRFAGATYIPFYLLIALSKVYGDGWLKTIFKGFFLLIGYFFCFGIILALGTLFTAVFL